ncbi:hypothetical protein HW555_005110 [Spodoptera exigua]|uniref:Uncharacterized protein n=1 Tax=Spodoptera exigua TaxID=7107 RepID=A0A835L5R6_SPOEX|nr:hypothetical protein HW555_005110 [Spodoptera exigua]
MQLSFHIPPISIRNFRKANWLAYKNHLEKEFNNFILPSDPQKGYDSFVKTINDAADLFIPYLKLNQNPTSKFISKPYWSSELSHVVAQRRLALSKFRRNPTVQNLDILKNRIHTAQRLIRIAKRSHWQEFCSSIDHNTSPSEMWHKLKWIKGYRSPRQYVDVTDRGLSNGIGIVRDQHPEPVAEHDLRSVELLKAQIGYVSTIIGSEQRQGNAMSPT